MPAQFCAAIHPDHPDLACLLAKSPTGHPQHLAMRYVEGRSAPEQVRWPDPEYRSPQQLKEEVHRARRTVHAAAPLVTAEIRKAQPVVPLQMKPGQRKKTRLGQVANMLVNHVGEWIEGHRLETEEIGGSSGLRRLRELRDEYGWNIEQRPTPNSTDQYRLVELPDEFKD